MKRWIAALAIGLLVNGLFAQPSGREFRRYNILNKNLISTVFTNGGVIGHPVDKGPRGAWLNDNNGYVGDVSPFVGAEIPYKISADSTLFFHSVTYCLADRRPNAQEQSNNGEFWGFEPKEGYFNPNKTGPAVAIFTDPETWPSFWPDRLDAVSDPGWPGQWNGFFGKGISNATEETYFAMDDDKDEEFNEGSNVWGAHFKPDSTDPLRGGMGLEVKVRALQWKQFLAQDVIFWLYEITNESTTNYNKTEFCMLVGTYVGVTSTEDVKEYDDDWSFFDAELDITYTGDFPDNNQRNPLWTGPVGMVGYAFLESPGNAFDGIDNDNDADKNFTSADFFNAADFDSVEILSGSQVVLINEDFERTVVTINSETTVVSQGRSYHIVPDSTKLVEGNVLRTQSNREFINPNANDGIDNDLDGLIDENFFLHYFQRRQDEETGEILINILRPLRFKNYITGLGAEDLMIDESRTDGVDNDGDWNAEFDDVGLDGLGPLNSNYTGPDFGEADGLPTSGAGTGQPGEPHIDLTDVDESDQIGLTSFNYFTNSEAPQNLLTDDEQWWNTTSPGNFDVPSSIVNNQPIAGEDGDFFYASGYFPLLAGRTERFSLALVYGGGRGGRNADLQDLLKNRKTVQKIFDSNYQFPKEPDTPTLRAEAGDGKVVLYWDRKAEKSFDPVLREFDFEGYRLYKSTDPKFNDVFFVTDADGKVRGYDPLQQWDLKNDIKNYFNGSEELNNAASGFAWYLGNDSGLQHSFVDREVENGRTYYYAITAYDHGSEEEDIFPSESPFVVTVLSSGEIVTGQNTVAVVPGTQVAGYVPPEKEGEVTQTAGPGNGSIFFEIIDEKATTGHVYTVEFWDTSNDGLDNDGDWNPQTDDLNANGIPDGNEPNVDLNDPDEFWPMTTSYTIRDMHIYEDEVLLEDSLFAGLDKENIIPGTVEVRDASGNVVDTTAYSIDYSKGRLVPKFHGQTNKLSIGAWYTVTYEYYPVFKSTNIGEIQTDPNEGALFDSDIFDGVQLSFTNYTSIDFLKDSSGWNRPDAYDFTFSTETIDLGTEILVGRRTPNNYQIDFFDQVVDTSAGLYGAPELPVNFTIANTTLDIPVEFIYVPVNFTPGPGGWVELSPFDQIYLFEPGPGGDLVMTWFLNILGDTTVALGAGDQLIIQTTKPFRRGDAFTFSTPQPKVDQALAALELENVRAVPNPYVVAHEHEAPLPPSITSGRGERKITFTHLPQKSKIIIFTARGEHVVTIEADDFNFNGTATWNLKNKENLDVAYGVYFYVVDSPVGKKRGKLAIIK